NSVDPLGGSYLVETMTSEMEQRVMDIFAEIEELGGVLPAIEAGYFQRRIADSAYRYEQSVAERHKIVMGVNALRNDEPADIPILKMDPEGEERQRERLARVRRERDPDEWQASLSALEQAARAGENLMPYLLRAVKAYATLGEMTN